MSTSRHVPGFCRSTGEGGLSAIRMPLVGRPVTAHHPGMAVLRALLLVLVAVLFVTTVSMIFFRDTGPLEKLVLGVVAVLLAVLVPRIQRIGRPVLP
jgi:hypothetical protein